MKVLISGIMGHMGQQLYTLCVAGYRDAEAVGGIDKFADENIKFDVPVANSFEKAITDTDIIIDFSHHSLTNELLDFAIKNNIPLVLATTGQTDEEKAAIIKAAEKIPLFFTANYSVGIALLTELAVQTAKAFPDAEIEIIEKHHDRKLDAPSGTALAIAGAIKNQVRPNAEFNCERSGYGKRTTAEIGIHAIRMGNIVGEHEILIGTQNQTISLKHEAHSRALFAEGALAAADFLIGKPAGLYDMNSMLGK